MKAHIWNFGVMEPHEEDGGRGADRVAHDPHHNWLQQKTTNFYEVEDRKSDFLFMNYQI